MFLYYCQQGSIRIKLALFKGLHSHAEGDGIELNIARNIVRNAGGEVEFKHEKGPVFQVYFKI